MTIPPSATTILIEHWNFELQSGADQPNLTGLVDGLPHRSAPIRRRLAPDLFVVRGGSVYRLGSPDTTVTDRKVPSSPMSVRWKAAQAAIAWYDEHGGPPREELEVAPEISNWQVMMSHDCPVLTGDVIGHPNIADGPIRTSVVVWMAPDHRCARTISRLYRLTRPFRPTRAERK